MDIKSYQLNQLYQYYVSIEKLNDSYKSILGTICSIVWVWSKSFNNGIYGHTQGKNLRT